MPAYIHASIEIIDAVGYEEYRARAPAVIAQYGGRYLIRGAPPVFLEGPPAAPRIVVLEFPDMVRLRAFYDSPEYAPLLAIRQRCARSTIIAIDGA
jgi:uncharacterized protein (DUF1330 family)